jgi:hypothetical protein
VTAFLQRRGLSCGPDAGCAARLLVIYFGSVELVPVWSYFGKKDLILSSTSSRNFGIVLLVESWLPPTTYRQWATAFFTKTLPSWGLDAGCAGRLLVIYFGSVELVPVLSYFGKKDLIYTVQYVFSKFRHCAPRRNLVSTNNLQTVSDSFFTKTLPSWVLNAGCAARLLVISTDFRPWVVQLLCLDIWFGAEFTVGLFEEWLF